MKTVLTTLIAALHDPPVFLSFLADGSRGQANDGGVRRRLSPH